MGNRRRKRKVNATGRNEGEGQYAPLSYTMLQSPAWRSLNGSAVKVFLELRATYNGRNNGELSLSFQRAADLLGMSKSSVARAFKQLEERGFVRKTKEGQWYGRLAAEYIVTDKSFNGHPAGRDWEKWRPVKT